MTIPLPTDLLAIRILGDWGEQTRFLENPVNSWILAAIVAGAAFGVIYSILLGLRVWLRKAEETEEAWDDVVAALAKATRFWVVVLVSLALGTLVLRWGSPKIAGAISSIAAIVVVLQFGFWGTAAVSVLAERYRKAADPARITTINVVAFATRAAIYTLVALLLLENVGIDVSALIAGLGVGGIAVALATQNVLKDLLASLSIVFDEPFRVGDFIALGDRFGTVKKIGLRTTRIRLLQGEELVVSNNELISTQIRNFRHLKERRIAFSVGITYETPAAKVRSIPDKVKEIVESQDQTRFDRAHFKSYGPSSLDFELVYFVTAPEYMAFMNIQQAINLALYDWFESEGIDFAYPTRTVHLANPPGAPA